MSEWSPPAGATPQDYPKQSRPGSGSDDLIARFRAFQVEVRDKFNNLLKQAGIRARPGMVTSTDFDGDGVDLGTQGWMLGAIDGGASLLALNGIDVYATLAARVADIALLQADLAAQQATLADQVAAMAAVVNAQVTGGVGNNYALTAVTSSWANYAGVGIPVPAGFTRAQVMAVSSVIGPTSDTWQIRVDIAGASGAEYTVFGNNGALGFSRNLTGLSGGSIGIATGVRNAIASGNNRGIATSATVTFLR